MFVFASSRCPSPSCVDVVDKCVEERVLLHPRGLQSLHSLQALVPSLLRREVELALETLGLVWDRAFAWDMFLVMMVRRHEPRALVCFVSLRL